MTTALERRLQQLEDENTRLRESESRLRFLFDQMDEGFCVIEFLDGPHGPLSDYVHIEANAAYARHAGIPNVVGQKVRDMVPGEAGGWVELYGGVLRTGEPIRFERELVATGRHLALSAFRIEPASLRQVAVLFQDVTPRKRAELELQQLNDTLEARVVEALAQRKLLADIVEGTNAFVQVVDTGLNWLAINSAAAAEAERVFGVRPRTGDSVLAMMAALPEQGEQLRKLWSRALTEDEFVCVAEFGDPARDRRSYEMRFSKLLDLDGKTIGAYQFAYDVTERLRAQERLRETEEALRHAQKLEAVGQLTGGIAHDFNNLLTGVMGSLDLLTISMQRGRHADAPRYIKAAQGAVRRAASLTHRLLAYSRRQTLDPKPTDVNKLVTGMEELVSRTVGPHIRLEVVTSPGLWRALIDGPQLENALLNLCINARDAMPHGGHITIETANKWLDDHAAREREVEPGQYLALSVTDSGAGMTPEVITRAFDPFFTTKPLGEGTGLGLSMVYGFVRQSGGSVRIYSEVGRGTTVSLYLPRHLGEADADATLPPGTLAFSTGGRGNVLVVDDEPTVRMLAFESLKEYGYNVIEAADGPSGLRVLRSGTPLDLMITDVGLPGGMNGRQLADAARETRPALKIIFITGYAENAVMGSGQLPQGMQVLSKPFAIGDLVYRVRQALER
jgi:signal transduction histidine kinase